MQVPPVQAAPGVDPAAVAFANSLLKQMTLQEKVGQMSLEALNAGPIDTPGMDPAASLEGRIRAGKIGGLLFTIDPAKIDRLQSIATKQSRLHIPLLVGFDVIHGFRTIYPVPIGMAASWEPSLAETAQHMAAREASAVGVRWAFAPMLDIARDPRWGRIMEGAGEDPYLGSRMAEAQVRGFQGKDLSSPDSLMACIKHFAGYGAAVGGRDYDESNISDEQLYNVYLPPFQAAVNAGAGSVMTAYMDLNGVPATANSFLLKDVLRRDWGFKGFVASDWASVESLTTHGYTANDHEAAVRAANAGLEFEMTSHLYDHELASAVKSGEVSEAVLDDAVRDMLVAKYRLGLFKNAAVDMKRASTELVTPEQRATARRIAAKTAVLLRNDGNLLPIRNAKRIAVIGPLADAKADTMGSWSLAGKYDDTVTLVEGMRRKFKGKAEIVTSTGVEIERVQPSIFDAQFHSEAPKLTTDEARNEEFAHAVEIAKSADVVVMALGELQSMSGENASRATLDLPGHQQQLLEAVVATGKPVVLVLVNARPLDITWASTHVASILEAWYPGTEGGNAVADLLAGDANPGGKLPFTWPRSAGQIPIYYNANLTQHPDAIETRYWDASSAPLYPFGYGLSYSAFNIANLRTSAEDLSGAQPMGVSVEVENTSATPGDEVVQLYIHQRSGSMSRPVRELKGFRRVTLAAHEKQIVTIPLSKSDLVFWSPVTHQRVLDPGTFDIWVGDSSQASLHGTFNLKK